MWCLDSEGSWKREENLREQMSMPLELLKCWANVRRPCDGEGDDGHVVKVIMFVMFPISRKPVIKLFLQI